MRDFTFHVPTRILFGKDRLGEIPSLIGDRTVLILYGSDRIRKTGLLGGIEDELVSAGIQVVGLGGVEPNPRIELVREGVRICRDMDVGFILAVGGGSVIDTAKLMALSIGHDGDPWDIMMRRVVPGEDIPASGLPIGVVLTIAAAGSEMNGNLVISNLSEGRKLALRTDFLRPVFSVLDPSLTFSVPRDQTANGIVDILSHLFENYFSPDMDATVSDRVTEGVMRSVIEAGPVVMNDPSNYEARATLMWASSVALNGITACGKIGDWATHAMEHGLSGLTDVAHGVGLAVLTPAWMEEVLSEETLPRFLLYARNVWGITGDGMDAARKGIEMTRGLFTSMGMPVHLRELGVKEGQLDEMAERSVIWGDIGFLKTLDKDGVLAVFRRAL